MLPMLSRSILVLFALMFLCQERMHARWGDVWRDAGEQSPAPATGPGKVLPGRSGYGPIRT